MPVPLARQVGQKCDHLRFRHLARVALAVVTDEARDPVAIAALRPDAVMAEAHQIAHLFEEFFGFALRGRRGQALGHAPSYHGRQPPGQADYTDFICL